MKTFFVRFVASMLCLAVTVPILAADNYDVDPVHSSLSFKIAHMGLTYVHGRFNDVAGKLITDKDVPKSLSFTVKADSIDTAQKKRDDHLRSPDFFNVKQYPTISFKSTAIKALDKGFEVTGDLTMHGVTKPVTFKLLGGKTKEFPPGMQRIGFYADFSVKRTDFGVGDPKLGQMLGDDVFISVGVEGVKK